MAPILRRKELLDQLEARVIPSMVVVKLFVRGSRKRKNRDVEFVAGTHYRSITGFIVESKRRTSLVLVHSVEIKPERGDILRVFFHGGAVRDASVFIQKTPHSHTVLKVKNPPPNCPAVTFHTQPYHRGDVFLLANPTASGLSSYSSTVIHPETTAYGRSPDGGFLKTKAKGSHTKFMFSLKKMAVWGLPVFDMAGLVAGIGMYQDIRDALKNPSLPCDITYAQHASYVVPHLLYAIQEQKKVAAGQ